ncbi:ligand-gated channel [Leminorella grimontii]|uniref:Ligand-gated channel n=1 Tax=Leminorella grimontii TaxID=82981 RepID=A0AAV5N1Q4_9GAMM|nr:TonB-dependent siderophore receptor [Leminorella grimontii]KFC96877.1 ferrichrome-iron receptor [Leminorella grimontii ATCC 33999 = DSM 5078]GKX56023.1 ligand-gated channel [Leminorella grimontii]GKX59072.1 ligand-gated channel [Leminorella grimontii]VFS57724.1 Ferric hydroxamate uptake [Leminorella grimontii]
MNINRNGMCFPKTRRSAKHMLLFCLPVFTYSGLAYSQDQNSNEEKEAHRVNTITVYGQVPSDDANTTVAKELWVGGKVATSVLDTPALVSVITEKEINQRNASTTEEILQYTPGLITDYYGSDDRNDYFKIRGFQATTYRDGMTLGSMRGVREDPYAYERVEVIRGANSTLFGPADPGGSVNFVSKRPKFGSFGNSYVSYGSFDHKEVGLDFGDALDEGKTIAYRLTTKIKDSDLEYDYSKDNSQFVMGGITWQPSIDTTATLIVDYLGQDSTPNSGGYPLDKEYDRSDFYGEPDYNKHDVDRTNVTAQVAHYISDSIKFSGNLRYSHLKDNYGYVYLYDYAGRKGSDLSRYYFGTDTSSRELIGNTIIQYDTSFALVDSSTLVGLEYRDASSHDKSVYGLANSINIDNPVYSGTPNIGAPYSKNDQDYTTKSAFLQQNLSFDDRYIVTFGARYDYLDLSNRDINGIRTSDNFSETSLRAAFTYKVTEEWSSYISQVESVAPPSIGVKPERGEQIEFGVKYAPQSVNALFSAAVYDLKKKDVTMAVVQPNGTIERETVGETRVKGFDFEMKAELTENLSLTGGYSYMKSDVVRGSTRTGASLEGNEFASAPNHTVSLWGYYTLPNQSMDVGLGTRYVGSYYFDADNTSKSEAAMLFDAAFSYRITKSANLSVNVHNITDKQYVVGSGTANYYNPGRSVNAVLHYSW